MSELYREIIIDHYKNPRNFGKLKDPDINGAEDNIVCGDRVEWFLKLDSAGRVKEVKWQGEGCALSQASASLLSEMLIGKKLTEINKLGVKDIYRIVGEKLNPSRQKCATLSVEALKQALTKK
ncbi:iron-sulfur cluster assembly scaffold protein [Candidatus Parcubacteria bacterium]|jgi:nitrogen fixation NifU-like protein|nr:MAG: iron-sulfur cluster assembly scaffold protein [Candidatus Parcubacteria bacterium]